MRRVFIRSSLPIVYQESKAQLHVHTYLLRTSQHPVYRSVYRDVLFPRYSFRGYTVFL